MLLGKLEFPFGVLSVVFKRIGHLKKMDSKGSFKILLAFERKTTKQASWKSWQLPRGGK